MRLKRLIPAFSRNAEEPHSHRLPSLMGRGSKAVVLGAGMLGLAACGGIKLVYNHGESLALLWAHNYIDLDRSQDALARDRIHAWFQWHRTTQLPEYALVAADLEKRVSAPVTQPEVSALESHIRLDWMHALERALPDAADLALTLRPAQLVKLAEKFASNDEKYRRRWVDVSVSHRNDLRYQKTLERIEYWYGKFSPEQCASVRHAVESQPVDPRLWLAEREDREKELVALLRHIAEQRPQRDVATRLLANYLSRIETSPDPKHRAYIETLDQSNRDLYVLVANLATARQRAHAVLKLQGWVEDLTSAAHT